MSKWMFRTVRVPVVLVVATALACPLMAREKTDVIVLINGDRVTGEVKRLQRGLLTVKTDFMDTVQIEWDKVKEIKSQYFFQVVTSNGERYLGSLETSPEDRILEVVGRDSSQWTEPISVVEIIPIAKTFLDRLEATVDLGFSFTRANRNKQLNLATTASYRVEKYLAAADFSTFLNSQKDVEQVRRDTLNLSLQRFLPNRWFAASLTNFTRDENINLDLRTLLGGGVGRHLIQRNDLLFAALGGGIYNRENYSGEDPRTSGEGFGGLQFQTFSYDRPKMDITAGLFAFPNFSEWGRIRLTLDTKLRIEIFKDFFWSASFYDNFDNRPPEGTETNTFDLVTSVGYRF